MKENDKFLVQALHQGKVDLDNTDELDRIAKKLIELAFEGGFSGGGAYFKWGCGSWLASNFEDVFAKCENSFKKDVYHYIDSIGETKNEQEWESLVDSYLLIPIASYKGKEADISRFRVKNELGLNAWKKMRAEWMKVGMMGYKGEKK